MVRFFLDTDTAPALDMATNQCQRKLDFSFSLSGCDSFILRFPPQSPMFPGTGEINQLSCIFNILGTPKSGDWPVSFDCLSHCWIRPWPKTL